MRPGVHYGPVETADERMASSYAESTTTAASSSYDMATIGRRQTKLGRAPTRRVLPGANSIANAGHNIQRGRTLIRPDRYQEPPPLLTGKPEKSRSWFEPWVLLSLIVTFWAPPALLRSMGYADKGMQQAWREKITLCFLIACLGGIVAFITIGVSSVLCPPEQSANLQAFARYNDTMNSAGLLGIQGWQFNVSQAATPTGVNFYDYTSVPGTDITNLFQHGTGIASCSDTGNAVANSFAAITYDPCSPNNGNNGCPLGAITDETLASLHIERTTQRVGFDWNTLASPNLTHYFVLNGNVLNMYPYMSAYPAPLANDVLDEIIRMVLNQTFAQGGRDATKMFQRRPELEAAMACLQEKYTAGFIDKITPGCFASQLILYFALGCVLSIVFARFAMALIFAWFTSKRLSRTPPPSSLNQSLEMSAVTAPLKGPDNNQMVAIGNDLYTVMLITCYSENTEGIRGTVESLSRTMYPDDRKLLFVIADGIITGHGETMTTPDMCLSLMHFDDPSLANPEPQPYVAVANGAKMFNRAKVYAGHYVCDGHKVPMVLVVKCGNPDEDGKPKAGNRGKRDSQLILMNFFSRVTYNDRMTPLDYELFQKITKLTGVTPDFYELCLMVDADTKVYETSLRLLVNCMVNDNLIMGLCGETKIANKRDSWVTAIQVYEYFISHHLAKGFESIFGGVTCLPGCFCMYRLKARKGDGDWVPIITKPEIVQEYSSNTIDTLHQKNLLLLGEDRFLTTLMLRNFPHRKMTFTPQAICKTVVPDEFKVLLSQRRRWINSTIHNLFELVLVRNLCGTFCFSMQFVVMMDLIGTLTLPVAIVLTVVLIASIAQTQITSFQNAVPLVLLLIVLFSPAILILLTSRKWVYVGWMFIYLLALPVWNFILPVYSYWHFDDFSWGETRKVEGETKGDGHGNKDGVFDPATVPMKRWDDYERKRARAHKRRERKERQLREMGPVHLTHAIVEDDEDESRRGLLSESRVDDDDSSFFDPTREAPASAESGYYPSFRPGDDPSSPSHHSNARNTGE